MKTTPTTGAGNGPVQIQCVAVYKTSSRFRRMTRLPAGLFLVVLVQGLASGHAQVTFFGNVPDYYQHQGYGSLVIPTWENTGGWCRQTTYLDLIYFWKVKNISGTTPYNDVLTNPNGNFTVNATWLAAFTDELPKLFNASQAAGFTYSSYLKNHTPDKGAGDGKGLIATRYFWRPSWDGGQNGFTTGGKLPPGPIASTVYLSPAGDNNDVRIYNNLVADNVRFNLTAVQIRNDPALAANTAQVDWYLGYKLLRIRINNGTTTANTVVAAVNASAAPWKADLPPGDVGGAGGNNGTGLITLANDEVDYYGSDNTFHRIANTMIGAYGTDLRKGSAVGLFFQTETKAVVPGNFAAALWWAGQAPGCFHNVAGAGVDVAGNRVIFADPDSNKGSFVGNAGWDATAMVKAGMPGKAATPPYAATDVPGDAATYNRRYLGTDPVPIPPGGSLNIPACLPWYDVLVLAADGRTVDNTIAANERYRNVTITGLDIIQKMIALPAAPADPNPTAFSITAPTDEGMDEIWLLPTHPVDMTFTPQLTLNSLPLPGWTVSFLPPGGFDPLGNIRVNGGVHALASNPIYALVSSNIAQLTYKTLGANTNYDVLYHSPGDGGDYSAQVVGGAHLPEPPLQVAGVAPTPSTTKLKIARQSVSSAVISWPSSFWSNTLQQTASLFPVVNWTTVPNAQVDDGVNVSVTVNVTSGSPRFYRLALADSPEVPITATAFAGTNGVIIPAGNLVLDGGTSLTFTAVPNSGYVVDSWYVDSDASPVQTGGTSLTLNSLLANHTVWVTFKP